MAPHVDALRIAAVLLDMLMNPGYRGGDIFGLRRILESVDGEPIASYSRDDAVGGKWPCDVSVLALFAVGDVYVSLCKKSAYAPFSVRRRSRALFWL